MTISLLGIKNSKQCENTMPSPITQSIGVVAAQYGNQGPQASGANAAAQVSRLVSETRSSESVQRENEKTVRREGTNPKLARQRSLKADGKQVEQSQDSMELQRRPQTGGQNAQENSSRSLDIVA